MPKTLYFYNSDLEQCIKVTGVLEEPAIENKTVKGKIYRLNWRSTNRSLDLRTNTGSEVAAPAQPVHGGYIADPAGTIEVIASAPDYINVSALKIVAPDDIAGRAGRQDDVLVPYWKCRVSTAAVPDYVWIAHWDFPSYGNCAPSWWVDPDAA